MKDYKTPVKASKLIAALEGKSIRAVQTSAGDLYPRIRSVDVVPDPETNKCSVVGYYYYSEDTAKMGVDPGRSEANILGVVFSSTILDDSDEVEISGREIVYDGDLSEDDVLAAAREVISFISYDPDDYQIEDVVTDEDILENIDTPYEVFALNSAGELCSFESEVDIPGYCDDEDEGEESSKDFGEYKIITQEEAYKIILKMPISWEAEY
jgi:hypothetical protein